PQWYPVALLAPHVSTLEHRNLVPVVIEEDRTELDVPCLHYCSSSWIDGGYRVPLAEGMVTRSGLNRHRRRWLAPFPDTRPATSCSARTHRSRPTAGALPAGTRSRSQTRRSPTPPHPARLAA